MIFFPPSYYRQKAQECLSKALAGRASPRAATLLLGEPQHSGFLPTPSKSHQQLGKTWGMPPLCPLQRGELCLGKSQDGCLGIAATPVLSTTTTKFFRTHALARHHSQWAPQGRGIWRIGTSYKKKIKIKLSLCLHYLDYQWD